MISREEATAILHQCNRTTVGVMDAADRGRVPKKADRAEKTAYAKAFEAMTGQKPTKEEMAEMIDW